MATINVERRSTIGLTILTVDSFILLLIYLLSNFIFIWIHPTGIIWIWFSLRIIPLLVIKAISSICHEINISISWAFPGRYLIIAWCIQILDFIVLATYTFITVYALDDPKTSMAIFPLPVFMFFFLQFMALLGIATYKGCNKWERSAEEPTDPDHLEPQIGANLDDSGFEQ